MMDVNRRQSRQVLLEEKFKIKVFELGRRHTLQRPLLRRQSRKVSVLPPISGSKDYIPTSTKERTKSISVAMSFPMDKRSFGSLINDQLPVVLPPILADRKQSVQNEKSHWNLPNRRVSHLNKQLIVDHLRTNLLRQHEKRSHDYEEEVKDEQDEELNDGTSEYNDDEETWRWKRAVRSRGPSLSTMNFSSGTQSRQENVFENSVDSLRSFVSLSQQSMSSSHFQSVKASDRQHHIGSRPSICVSFAPTSPEEPEPAGKETKLCKSESKEPSHLHRSISESEKSVHLLMQRVRRRSEVFDISGSDKYPGSVLDRNTPERSIRSRNYTEGQGRTGAKKVANSDDVYSDLPIGKVNLFADWTIQIRSPSLSPTKSPSFNHSDFDRPLSRSSCVTADSRPITAYRSSSRGDSGSELECVETNDFPTEEILDESDVDFNNRTIFLQQISLGDVSLIAPKLKRKVLIYLSSVGIGSDEERAALSNVVHHQLRHFCNKRQLDFEMIDLNSLPSDAKATKFDSLRWWSLCEDPHTLPRLRLRLIRRCFAESVGPSFVNLFGQHLDPVPPLPATLPQFVFEGLLSIIEKQLSALEEKISALQTCLSLQIVAEESKHIRIRGRGLNLRRASQTGNEVAKNEDKLKQLQDEATKLKNDQLLLNDWFCLDTNAKPPLFRIRTISTKFPSFLPSKRALASREEKRRDEENWKHTEVRLLEILREYTEARYCSDLDSNERVREWRKDAFKSALEMETNLLASLSPSRVRESCFWFQRQILKPDLNSKRISDFLSLDQAVQTATDFLRETFGFANTRAHSVTWSALQQAYRSRDRRSAKPNHDWLMYLEHLRSDFTGVCRKLIENAVTKRGLKNLNDSVEEIHQHVVFSQGLSKGFHGRDDVMNEIKTYLCSKKSRTPFILSGPVGSGKSSILSRASQLASSWMRKRRFRSQEVVPSGDNPVPALSCRILFRSIGLTGDSSDSRSFLIGVCEQLQQIENAIDAEEDDVSKEKDVKVDRLSQEASSKYRAKDFKSLTVQFDHLLTKCGQRHCPLLIFLDDIDAISSNHGARDFKWIPRRLPRYVKIVGSLTGDDNVASDAEAVSPKRRPPLARSESLMMIKETQSVNCASNPNVTQLSHCMASLKVRFDSGRKRGFKSSNFSSISSLESDVSEGSLSASNTKKRSSLSKILQRLLRRGKLNLTDFQIDALLASCRSYPHPLAAAICVEISREWTSQTTHKECVADLPSKADSVDPFVHCFFRHLESRHGRPLVGAVACHITTSLNGLTSSELRDLLSYDKAVAKWLSDISSADSPVNAQCAPSNNLKGEKTAGRVSLGEEGVGQAKKKTAKAIENFSRKNLPDFLFYCFFDELKFFLAETLSDKKLTFRWKHKVFRDISTKRYMPMKEAQQRYHHLMAYYFNDSFPSMPDKQEQEQNPTPHSSIQPLYWKSPHDDQSKEKLGTLKKGERTDLRKHQTSSLIFNLRRLSESFHHYLCCRSLEDIKENLLFNYEWLFAKIRATGYQSVLSNISSALAIHPSDKDLRLLAEALYLSRDVLEDDPTQLAGQLVGRLFEIVKKDKPLARMDPRKYPFCRQLIGQCRRSSLPVLIPSGTCLSSPGDVLYDLLLGHDDVITAIAMTTDGQSVITASKDQTIKVWDLFSGCVVSTLEGMPRHVTSLSVCLGNNYVCIVDSSNKIQVISLLKSSCLLEFVAESSSRVVATIAGDGLSFLVLFSDQAKEMKVWDLNSVRLLHKIDILPDGCKLREDQHVITGRIAAANSNIFYSFHSSDQAYVYNVKRAKHLHTLKLQQDGGPAHITHVEASREYYVIVCRRQYMHLHEIVTFELYDSINYGHVRALKACPEDKISDIFVNRLGSHLIGLCHVGKKTVIGVWNVESGLHQHLASQKFRSTQGFCVDLQYCVTWHHDESTLHVHNLARRIDDKTLSRTHVKKTTSGIGEFYPVTSNSRYVVARGLDNGPITVWNIARGRCKGEAVSIERGLLEKNDVIVVKDAMVIVLSDRGISSGEFGSYPQIDLKVFNTIYLYDLRMKKYSGKLTGVSVTVCPRYEYRILGSDKLLAISPDRSAFLVWSLVDGQILNKIAPDYSKYENAEKREATESRDKKRKLKRAAVKTSAMLSLQKTKKKISTLPKKTRKFHLSEDERMKLIDQMLISEDESALLCSFYGRHVAVFDMNTFTHIHTLTNEHSMLLLHQAEITANGSHFIHTNYDDEVKLSYVSVWNLKSGKLDRRLRNEPYVCALAVASQSRKVVFVTEDNYLKIWEPYRRGGHHLIPGYDGLRMRKGSSEFQGTTLHLTSSADRAILFTYDISIWDLEAACLLARFSPDIPFQCCAVAMNGNLVVAGMREQESAVTMRLLSRDIDVAQYGRSVLGEERGEFGEEKEKDSESSEDELMEED